MASVSLRGLKKSFGTVDVIHGIDLEIAEGEFIALVGPSGCGKSTLLRMIAGLEGATAGEIRIHDRVVNLLTPRERNIAMVFQSYALYPHMTVRGNIEFNLKLAGMAPDQRRARVEQTAQLLEISDLLERRPGQLSGGQRQRVAMGRAVVRDPVLFLFDEPLSNLDAKLRVQMRTEIKALHQKVRKTSLYVTHDQIEAMTLADRIVVLSKGRIEQVGTPLELYRKPDNVFVAAFIGSPAMNLLPATIAHDANGPVARLDDGQTIALEERYAGFVGRAITVGVRPEHLSTGGVGSRLSGRVRLVEPTGAQTHVTLTLAGQNVMAFIDGREDALTGLILEVVVAAECVHVFDGQTGLRLETRL
jgi:multiple sugar transport system ATP-binding protein